MLPGGKSLEQAEAEAYKYFARELERHNQFAIEAFNLVGHTLSSVPDQPAGEIPDSRRVTNVLLNRVSNDLRAVLQLVNHGYALQGLGLAAALYEAAFTIPYVGTNDALAGEWIDYSDFTKPFRGAYTLTRDGLRALGCPDVKTQTDMKYLVYRQFCMAKHSNPLLQRRHGVTFTATQYVLHNGPDVSEEALRASWFALEHASALTAFIATAGFLSSHVPQDKRPPLADRLQLLDNVLKTLGAEARAKWGTTNPFPDKS